MKNLVKHLPFICLFLISCGANSSSDESVSQELINEIKALESESQAIEAITDEIDQKTVELDSLLNILGNF